VEIPTRYPIRIGSKSGPLLRVAFGATPDRAWASVDAESVIVHFGRFELAAPVASVTRWRIEGPWHWVTAIGIRLSIRHRDISFAGSPRGGVRLDLGTPVRWGPLSIPAIYAGVDDLEGFAGEFTRRGIPGEDARVR
jgi:hypothetical protein